MDEIQTQNRHIYCLVLFLISFIQAAILGLLGTALPDLICIMDTDLKSASSLFFSFGVGRCLTCIIGIFVNDRLDVTLTTVCSLVATAVTLLMVPNSTYLPVTIFVFLITGGCVGILENGRYLMMRTIWPTTNSVYHFVSSGVAVSSLTTPLFGSLFVRVQQPSEKSHNLSITSPNVGHQECATNIHFAYLMISLMAVLVAAGYLTNYYSLINKGIYLSKLGCEEHQTRKSNAGKSFKYKCFVVLLLCLFSTITACMTSVFTLLVTYGMRSKLHLDVRTMSAVTSSFSIGVLCARIFCGFIADRVKPQVLLLFCLTVLQVTSVIFIFYRDSSVLMLWIVTVFRGLGAGPIVPCFITWARSHVNMSARFIFIFMTFVNIGNLVHPTLSGILMDLYGPDMYIYTSAMTSFVQFVLFGMLSVLAGGLKSEEK